MPEYTLLTAFAVIAVITAELVYFTSGIFRTAQYWWLMVIIFVFQIPVDGWLTKLSAPIVIYNPDEILGLRATPTCGRPPTPWWSGCRCPGL